MDDHPKHQPAGIDEQMAFASRQPLGPSIAVRAAALARLDRLTIQDGGTRCGLAPAALAHPFTQDGVDVLPEASGAPGAEGGRGGVGPETVVAWHQTPLTAAAEHVQDAIEDAAQVDGARTPTRLGRWQQQRQDSPLVSLSSDG